MASFSGEVYASGTLTANGNSSWIDLHNLVGFPTPLNQPDRLAIEKATLYLVPEDLATDETLDLDLNVAWDSAGATDLKVHDFTQVDSNNTNELLILPGGDSEAVLSAIYDGTSEAAYRGGARMPPWWKFAWTLGGTTKSMQFTVYGSFSW